MLELQPITFREASEFIDRWHSHRGATRGWKFGIGVNDGERVVGVVVVGRPVSRHLDDGWTVEVTRCCTDGSLAAHNAASMLYAAAWRAARAMGYRRLVTYTLEEEEGVGLVAAGYKVLYRTKDEAWHRQSRPRVNGKEASGHKLLWEKSL